MTKTSTNVASSAAKVLRPTVSSVGQRRSRKATPQRKASQAKDSSLRVKPISKSHKTTNNNNQSSVVTTAAAAKSTKSAALARSAKGKKVSAGKTIQIHSSASTKSTKAKIVQSTTSKDDPLAAAEDDAKTVDDQPQFLATMELSEQELVRKAESASIESSSRQTESQRLHKQSTLKFVNNQANLNQSRVMGPQPSKNKINSSANPAVATNAEVKLPTEKTQQQQQSSSSSQSAAADQVMLQDESQRPFEKKDLSAIDEATRETSSMRHTEQGVQERVAWHIKKMNSFISKAQQRSQLQGNRRQALLSTVDEKKDLEEVFASLQFFMAHFKLTSADQNTEIVSLTNRLPSVFEMLKKSSEASRVGYLCKTLGQNIQQLPTLEISSSKGPSTKELSNENLPNNNQSGSSQGISQKQKQAKQEQVKVKREHNTELPAPTLAMSSTKCEQSLHNKPLILDNIFAHSALLRANHPQTAAVNTQYEVLVQAKVFINELTVANPSKLADSQNTADIKTDSLNSNSTQGVINNQLCQFNLQQSMMFGDKKQSFDYVLKFM